MAEGERRPLRVGILGAGMIATAPHGFLPNLHKLSDRVVVTAIASRTRSLAEFVAAQFAIPAVFDDLATMLTGADLDAVVNLTPIQAHYETSMRIIAAGKHLVSEKPLATTLDEADALCAAADRNGVLIVAAPTDMLGQNWQEAQRLVAAGAIGRPAFARVQSSHGGPAMMGWPMDPTWFYQPGAGSLFDMGAYGLHRITTIFGPARRVTAFSGITEPVRHARGGPFDGLAIDVREPDNTLMLLDFGNALFASVDATYNVVASRSPLVEIYGNLGTLLVNPPLTVPSIELFRLDAAPGSPGWITPTVVGFPPPADPTVDLQRAFLIGHLADCLDSGKRPLLSGEHSRHVLEIMLAAQQSARSGVAVDLMTSFPHTLSAGSVR